MHVRIKFSGALFEAGLGSYLAKLLGAYPLEYRGALLFYLIIYSLLIL